MPIAHLQTDSRGCSHIARFPDDELTRADDLPGHRATPRLEARRTGPRKARMGFWQAFD